MNAHEEVPLADRRQALRAKLLAQRQMIAKDLERGSRSVDYAFPRSKIMKFLTRRSGLTPTLLAGATAFLVGGRYTRALTAVVSVARIMRSKSRPAGPTG